MKSTRPSLLCVSISIFSRKRREGPWLWTLREFLSFGSLPPASRELVMNLHSLHAEATKSCPVLSWTCCLSLSTLSKLWNGFSPYKMSSYSLQSVRVSHRGKLFPITEPDVNAFFPSNWRTYIPTSILFYLLQISYSETKFHEQNKYLGLCDWIYLKSMSLSSNTDFHLKQTKYWIPSHFPLFEGFLLPLLKCSKFIHFLSCTLY